MSSESDSEGDRIQSILALAPRRFHISANPPFGAGFVIFGHENEDISEDELENFILQNNAIKNCKPGIWTSLSRAVENPGPDGATHPGDADREHILRWVCEGTIDISQSVEEWKAYEEATRKSDAEVKVSQIVPKGTKWRRWGTYYDDGGVCTIVSGEYITHDAARSILFGDKDSTEELEFGYYLETLSLNGTEIGTSEDQQGLTIGGLNCMSCHPGYD